MINYKNKIGALWVKENNFGRFMTGEINNQKVFVKLNKKRPDKKDPDWQIFTIDSDDQKKTEMPSDGSIF